MKRQKEPTLPESIHETPRENSDAEVIDEFLDTTSLDDIYPFSWEEQHMHIESGGNYLTVLAIVGYPTRQTGNWLADLKRKKGNITIVQHLESADDQVMIAHYNESIKNKEVEKERTVDPYHRKQLQKQIDSAYMQMDKLDDDTTYLYQHTYLLLQATSEEELKHIKGNVERTLKKSKLRYLTPVKGMYQSYWSTLPIGTNLLAEYTSRLSNTDAASSFIPIDDAEIIDLSPRAQVEGINKETDSLVSVDYTDTYRSLNQNAVIIGTSGVGKSTYMAQKILRSFAMGSKTFIIDPENEYTRLVESLGGQVIHLSSNAKTKINPLQLFSNDTGEGDPSLQHETEHLIKAKIQRLKGFFHVIKPDLTQVEKSLLDTILRDTYADYGIYKFDDVASIPNDRYPTLRNVYDQMEKLRRKDPDRYKKIENLHIILDSYCSGSNSLFNGHTNVDVKGQLVSFNLKPLQNEQDVQAAAYLNIFSFLWDEITKDKEELIYCFIDEFHFLTKNPDSVSFFYNAYKRFRKYNAGAIAGTQQIQDVLDTHDNLGAGIIENSYTKMFFGLDNMGVDEVVSKLKIKFSEQEKSLLRAKRQREALFIHGSNRAFMKVELTQEELRLWDPEQYERTYGEPADIQPKYEVEMSPSEIEEAREFQI
ncbi:VirB4 family type IV secretion system protein [Thalassorhabdus alkalitolerans]|uniref:VirB4 family type IV secretion system protein n=1 Tax=Thalassorhabdus alkalitolerans TaxID=2282697 RepID=A0ABW0YQI1_9BACI